MVPPIAVVVRRDLSHPVHSDNCILNEATGECDKVPPAYTWRHYRLAEERMKQIRFNNLGDIELSPESIVIREYTSSRCMVFNSPAAFWFTLSMLCNLRVF